MCSAVGATVVSIDGMSSSPIFFVKEQEAKLSPVRKTLMRRCLTR
jgi:hypothetical protein